MTKFGIDYIGLENYWLRVAKHHKKGLGIGYLANASGWSNGTVAMQKVLNHIQANRVKPGETLADYVPFVRCQGLWRKHVFTKRHIRPARRQARIFRNRIVNNFSGIKMLYSPWLEHRETALARRCMNKCDLILPDRVKLVSSGPDLNMDKVWNEVHHGAPKRSPYIHSMDGLDQFDTQVSRWIEQHRGAKYFFGWIPECNGLEDIYDKTPRNRRTNWITARQIKLLGRQLHG